MRIYKVNGNDCGGFQKPKGHLDTQMFPECEGKETDRNIVKKTLKRRHKKNKSSFNLQELKQAERSRMRDDAGNIISGPDNDKITPSYLKMMKMHLEEKFPNVIWTLDRIMKFINDNFVGKAAPFDKPKDLYHGD